MMRPDSICVSLEWAKKLNWEGSLFAFFFYDGYWDHGPSRAFDKKDVDELVYSPTAEEILRELPLDVGKYELQIYRCGKDGWAVAYYDGNHEPLYDAADCQNDYPNDSLANAAASMWEYLKENDLLSQSRLCRGEGLLGERVLVENIQPSTLH